MNISNNIKEFKQDFYESCTENSLLPKITVNLMKCSIFIFGLFIIAYIGIIGYHLKTSKNINNYLYISIAIYLVILFIYLLVIFYTGKKEIRKITKSKTEGLLKFSSDGTRKILESKFDKLLDSYNINPDDKDQIDAIIDMVESSHDNGTELIIKSLIPGAIVYKIWETIYDLFEALADKITFAIITIGIFIMLLMLWYLFEQGYLHHKRKLDKELILRLKAKKCNLRKKKNIKLNVNSKNK